MLIVWLALLEFTTIAFKPVFSTLFKSSSRKYTITKIAIPTLNEALERGASFWLS
jgi:hypothetical protein